MPIHTSLAPFKPVLRKLNLFKPFQPGSQSHATILPGQCPGTTPHSNWHILTLIPPNEVFLNIWKSTRHELRMAHGLTFMTPSPHWCETFQTPGALTHTMMTWAFSPSTSQVPGITPRSPLCLRYSRHSFWRGAQHSPPPNGIDALIDYTRSRAHQFLSCHPLWCIIVLTLGRDPHNASSNLVWSQRCPF